MGSAVVGFSGDGGAGDGEVVVVNLNPKLKEKSNKTTLFSEDCVRLFGYEAMVERFLELEVTGLDQDGQPIKVDA
ncbi:peptide deformylase 1A, chloroplastic-like protein [Tanacetum coccineum]